MDKTLFEKYIKTLSLRINADGNFVLEIAN